MFKPQQSLFSGLCCALLVSFSSSVWAEQTSPSPLLPVLTPISPTDDGGASKFGLPDFSPIVKATENAVVNIRTMAPTRSRGGDFYSNDQEDMFRFFFGPDFQMPGPRAQPPRRNPRGGDSDKTVPSGVGSGFIISADGYIITNEHVVDGASKIIVSLHNNKEYTAKLIGSDKRTDLALLKIEADQLNVLSMGNSDSLLKGQWVLAIGSPYDLESTVTAGIVSAINRDTGDYLPFIQTDVAINPGNSGGPLIDLHGRVVGVNTQIFTSSGGSMGISFSIPINEAMKVVEQLKSTGMVQRGRIGVLIGEVEKEVADALGLASTAGALVGNVEANSPAEKAGIKSGDVIVSFDGRQVNKWTDLPRVVGQTKPGTTADIEVWRRGKLLKLSTTIDSFKTDNEMTTQKTDETPAVPSSEDRLGLTVSELSKSKQSQMRVNGGVLVEDAKGIGAEAGLLKGDIILTINNQDIQSVAQFSQIVKDLPAQKLAAILVRRGNFSQWVTVTPPK